MEKRRNMLLKGIVSDKMNSIFAPTPDHITKKMNRLSLTRPQFTK
jgi:hypothetical protein